MSNNNRITYDINIENEPYTLNIKYEDKNILQIDLTNNKTESIYVANKKDEYSTMNNIDDYIPTNKIEEYIPKWIPVTFEKGWSDSTNLSIQRIQNTIYCHDHSSYQCYCDKNIVCNPCSYYKKDGRVYLRGVVTYTNANMYLPK